MRNILLVMGVFTFTSASAQFDIKEHLKKKQEKKTTKVENKYLPTSLPKISGIYKVYTPAQSKAHILPNGDRVITNPQYNMPIVVTDIKGFKTMPNAGEDYFAKNFYIPGQQNFNDIPNGAAEWVLPNKLQELLDKYRSK